MQEYTDERIFMNTKISIKIFSSLGTIDSRIHIKNAFEKFDYVMKNFTRFEMSSQLSKLNNHMHKKNVIISDELFKLIEYTLYLAKISNGLFDPTVIDYLELYGYKKNSQYEQLDDPDLETLISRTVNNRPKYTEIILDKKNLSISMHPRQRIDLGAIGKGYAVDLAYEYLDKYFDSFMINAGGDVRIKGTKTNNDPWTISILNPVNNESLGTLKLTNKAIASSGSNVIKFKKFHHLINPQNGLPQNIILQSTIIADTCMEADGWATILFFMGSKGLQLLEKYKMSGLVYTEERNLLTTQDIVLY
jgi:FAD:protein FMN transferase